MGLAHHRKQNDREKRRKIWCIQLSIAFLPHPRPRRKPYTYSIERNNVGKTDDVM
jgi:hypothetical protein